MPKRLRDDTAKRSRVDIAKLVLAVDGGVVTSGWLVNDEEGDHSDALFFVNFSGLVRD